MRLVCWRVCVFAVFVGSLKRQRDAPEKAEHHVSVLWAVTSARLINLPSFTARRAGQEREVRRSFWPRTVTGEWKNTAHPTPTMTDNGTAMTRRYQPRFRRLSLFVILSSQPVLD